MRWFRRAAPTLAVGGRGRLENLSFDVVGVASYDITMTADAVLGRLTEYVVATLDGDLQLDVSRLLGAKVRRRLRGTASFAPQPSYRDRVLEGAVDAVTLHLVDCNGRGADGPFPKRVRTAIGRVGAGVVEVRAEPEVRAYRCGGLQGEPPDFALRTFGTEGLLGHTPERALGLSHDEGSH